MEKNEFLTTQKKIKILLEKLKFKNLIEFSDSVIDGKYNRALGLSCGRIKNFNKYEIEILENKYNINKNWLLFGNGPIFQIFTKENLEEFILKIEVINENQTITNGFYFDKRVLGNLENGIDRFLFLFCVKDDSLKNTLSKNDLLLCYDINFQSNKNEIEDGIYLIKINNKLVLRRLTNSIKEENKIYVTTDTENSTKEAIEKSKLPSIYGKMIKTIKID